MRLTPLAALAAAVALVASGCGAAAPSSSKTTNGAASLVPSSAVAFVSASSDLSSPAWHGVGKLLLEGLPKGMSGGDLQQAAGDEVDVAVLQDGKTVAFVQPGDEQKLETLAKQKSLTLRKIGDWTAVSDSAAALDAVAGSTSHLSEDTLFQEAMNRLPGDALVRAYANGAEAGKLLQSLDGQLVPKLGSSTPPLPDGGAALARYRWLAAAVTSQSDGLKIDAVAAQAALTTAPRPDVQPVAPYRPELLDRIPAGVIAVADFKLPQGALALLPGLLHGAAGSSSLPSDLGSLLGGETAVYVRGGLPLPEVTFVTEPADPAAAVKALDGLTQSLPQGTPVSGMTFHHALVGGRLVVSTTQAGIDDFAGSGAKLASDPGFAAAAKQAGLPHETSGFVYVDAKDALALAGLAGLKLPANLPDFRSVLAYGSQQAGETTFTAFVGIH